MAKACTHCGRLFYDNGIVDECPCRSLREPAGEPGIRQLFLRSKAARKPDDDSGPACLECGRPLGAGRRLRGSLFCSEDHQRQFQWELSRNIGIRLEAMRQQSPRETWEPFLEVNLRGLADVEDRAQQVIAPKPQNRRSTCLYCGQVLSLQGLWKSAKFCSEQHEQMHQRKQTDELLARLSRMQRIVSQLPAHLWMASLTERCAALLDSPPVPVAVAFPQRGVTEPLLPVPAPAPPSVVELAAACFALSRDPLPDPLNPADCSRASASPEPLEMDITGLPSRVPLFLPANEREPATLLAGLNEFPPQPVDSSGSHVLRYIDSSAQFQVAIRHPQRAVLLDATRELAPSEWIEQPVLQEPADHGMIEFTQFEVPFRFLKSVTQYLAPPVSTARPVVYELLEDLSDSIAPPAPLLRAGPLPVASAVGPISRAAGYNSDSVTIRMLRQLAHLNASTRLASWRPSPVSPVRRAPAQNVRDALKAQQQFLNPLPAASSTLPAMRGIEGEISVRTTIADHQLRPQVAEWNHPPGSRILPALPASSPVDLACSSFFDTPATALANDGPPVDTPWRALDETIVTPNASRYHAPAAFRPLVDLRSLALVHAEAPPASVQRTLRPSQTTHLPSIPSVHTNPVPAVIPPSLLWLPIRPATVGTSDSTLSFRYAPLLTVETRNPLVATLATASWTPSRFDPAPPPPPASASEWRASALIHTAVSRTSLSHFPVLQAYLPLCDRPHTPPESRREEWIHSTSPPGTPPIVRKQFHLVPEPRALCAPRQHAISIAPHAAEAVVLHNSQQQVLPRIASVTFVSKLPDALCMLRDTRPLSVPPVHITCEIQVTTSVLSITAPNVHALVPASASACEYELHRPPALPSMKHTWSVASRSATISTQRLTLLPRLIASSARFPEITPLLHSPLETRPSWRPATAYARITLSQLSHPLFVNAPAAPTAPAPLTLPKPKTREVTTPAHSITPVYSPAAVQLRDLKPAAGSTSLPALAAIQPTAPVSSHTWINPATPIGSLHTPSPSTLKALHHANAMQLMVRTVAGEHQHPPIAWAAGELSIGFRQSCTEPSIPSLVHANNCSIPDSAQRPSEPLPTFHPLCASQSILHPRTTYITTDIVPSAATRSLSPIAITPRATRPAAHAFKAASQILDMPLASATLTAMRHSSKCMHQTTAVRLQPAPRTHAVWHSAPSVHLPKPQDVHARRFEPRVIHRALTAVPLRPNRISPCWRSFPPVVTPAHGAISATPSLPHASDVQRPLHALSSSVLAQTKRWSPFLTSPQFPHSTRPSFIKALTTGPERITAARVIAPHIASPVTQLRIQSEPVIRPRSTASICRLQAAHTRTATVLTLSAGEPHRAAAQRHPANIQLITPRFTSAPERHTITLATIQTRHPQPAAPSAVRFSNHWTPWHRAVQLHTASTPAPAYPSHAEAVVSSAQPIDSVYQQASGPWQSTVAATRPAVAKATIAPALRISLAASHAAPAIQPTRDINRSAFQASTAMRTPHTPNPTARILTHAQTRKATPSVVPASQPRFKSEQWQSSASQPIAPVPVSTSSQCAAVSATIHNQCPHALPPSHIQNAINWTPWQRDARHRTESTPQSASLLTTRGNTPHIPIPVNMRRSAKPQHWPSIPNTQLVAATKTHTACALPQAASSNPQPSVIPSISTVRESTWSALTSLRPPLTPSISTINLTAAHNIPPYFTPILPPVHVQAPHTPSIILLSLFPHIIESAVPSSAPPSAAATPLAPFQIRSLAACAPFIPEVHTRWTASTRSLSIPVRSIDSTPQPAHNGAFHPTAPWLSRPITAQRFSRLRHAFSTQRFPHTPQSVTFSPYIVPAAAELAPHALTPRHRLDVKRWASPSGRGQVLMVLPDAILETLPRPKRGITRILR